MSGLYRALSALFRTDLSTMVQYRGESFLWALWGVIYPAVAMAMWQAVANDPTDGSGVAAFGRSGFAAYFLISMIIGHVTAAWDAYEMGYFVRHGTFSGWLLQPLLPIWKSAAGNLAWKLFTTLILTPLWVLVGWWAQPSFHLDLLHVTAGIAAALMAIAIAFLWGYIVALAAFWTTRTDAIGELWFGGAMLFGGRLAPIELLPAPLYYLSFAMPHQWMLGFPTEVLMGHASVERILSGLIWQVAWLVGGLVTFRFTWRASIKRYSAVGA
jgi:ABC-2 type transport system permease protein